jgi:hypothetical protein
MTEQEIIERWKSMSGNNSGRPWTNDQVVGFFQAFRPYGQSLSEALDGVVGTKEILPRLLEVYQATASGWDQGDAYFVVRTPNPLSQVRARLLVITHLQRFADIAKAVGASELLALLAPLPRIEVIQGQTPWPPSQDDPETLIYEARTEFMASLTPSPSHALLLKESIYNLACDYFLGDHILWPLYQHSTTLVEPFESYFELWKHGAGMRFVNDNLVRAFVPALGG